MTRYNNIFCVPRNKRERGKYCYITKVGRLHKRGEIVASADDCCEGSNSIRKSQAN